MKMGVGWDTENANPIQSAPHYLVKRTNKPGGGDFGALLLCFPFRVSTLCFCACDRSEI